jgi:hypothetical protein
LGAAILDIVKDGCEELGNASWEPSQLDLLNHEPVLQIPPSVNYAFMEAQDIEEERDVMETQVTAADATEPHGAVMPGVKEDYIVTTVQSMPKFARVTRSQIERSLRKWITDSEIFECGYKEYRVIT